MASSYIAQPTPTDPEADALSEQNTELLQAFVATDWNPTATTFEQASNLLRNCVKQACIQKLYMKEKVVTSPLGFIMEDGVPEQFHILNNNPRGCVDIKVTVKEVNRATGQVLNQWLIHLDADQENPGKQRPHFGYDVSGTPSSKFTGHVWLPSNPPNYRDDGRPGREDVQSSFERQKGGNLWFEMTKITKMFRF